MGTYVAIMRSMFSRLSEPLSEEKQLRVLCRNISPFYQTQLGLAKVTLIQELVEFGRTMEKRRSASDNYVPSSKKKNDLEPDLAYAGAKASSTPAVSILAFPLETPPSSL